MNISVMMKICPKCGVEHSKQGLYCSRKCANSRTWSEEDKLKKSIAAKNSERLKTAILKNTTGRKNYSNICLYCNKEIKNSRKSQKYHATCWRKVAGGKRQGSGRGKKGWYESKIASKVFLDSSYELEYAKYLDENNINWRRNTTRFYYLDLNKKERYYIPDFYLVDTNEYIEIKGFERKEDKLKWSSFPFKLTVLFGRDLKEMGLDIIL